MSAYAVEVQNLSKEFTVWIDRPSSFKELMIQAFRGRTSGKYERTQVLEDVNFKIRFGESVGIMGRNGVGKSTILKILSGIYQPTSGSVVMNAPFFPLIELGSGFHPDLSGYENIFLYSAIAGYSRKDTLAAIPKIIEFSELGDKIHLPTKYFSSGMQVRLGFSIAIHHSAPILLFDEVLAVGDVGFQNKCLARIAELKREGRTIVLVTHDPGTIQQHCERCIVIDSTRLVFDGPSHAGAQRYLDLVV